MVKKFKRKGIAISPGMNRVRIILLFIVTPLLTWYAHQRFTNPFKKHVSYELCSSQGEPVLHIYNETSVKKTDLLYIPLRKKSTAIIGSDKKNFITYDSDSTFLFTDNEGGVAMKQLQTETVSLRMFQGLLFVEGPFFSIVVAFENVENSNNNDIDLLLAYEANDAVVTSLRKVLRPRLTITNSSNLAASNIYRWNGKKRLFFSEERYNKLSVAEIEED